jgi:hypothetical protein
MVFIAPSTCPLPPPGGTGVDPLDPARLWTPPTLADGNSLVLNRVARKLPARSLVDGLLKDPAFELPRLCALTL